MILSYEQDRETDADHGFCFQPITRDCSIKRLSWSFSIKKIDVCEFWIVGWFIVPREFKTILTKQITGGPKVNILEQITFKSDIEGS